MEGKVGGFLETSNARIKKGSLVCVQPDEDISI